MDFLISIILVQHMTKQFLLAFHLTFKKLELFVVKNTIVQQSV